MSLLDDVSIVVTPNGYKAGELYAVVPVPTEGAEEVTNGDFATDSAWTLSSGLTFSAGAILFDDDNDNLFQNWTDTVNTLYKLTITKTGSGTLRFRSGFAGTDGVRIDIPESGIIYFTSTSDTNRIQIYGDISDVSATLNSVSVKEYTAADMDVTRATAATRVDEAGLVNYAEIIGSEEVTDGDFSQEGAEKVTNGDFSADSNWNQVGSNGWSIDTGTSTLNFTNASSYVFQGISTVSGKSYKVTLDIELNSGTIVAKSFSAQDVLTVTSTGRQTVTGYFTEIDSNANFGFVASGSASGKIHSVSVKEVGADWTISGAWSLGTNKVIFSDTTNGDIRTSSAIFTATKTYQIKLTVADLIGANTAFFAIGDGSASNLVGYDNYANGDYTFNAIAPNGSELRIFSTTSSGSSYSITNVSVKEVTRDNVPRIDYTGGGCPHILAEPQRTNLVIYSEDFSNAAWSKSSVGIDTSIGTNGINPNIAISPDGTLNSDRVNFLLQSDRDSGMYEIISASTGNSYTTSVYLKGEGSNIGKTIKIRIKRVTGGSFVSVDADYVLTGEWVRLEMNPLTLSGANSNALLVFTSNDATSCLMYGCQVEEGSYPTSIIPTSGSTVTRNQDQFTRDGIGSLINSTEGVLFVEMAALSDDGTGRYISISDGGTQNVIRFYFSTNENQIVARYYVGNSVQSNFSHTLTDATIFNKIAFKYKENDFALWVNGVEVETDTSGTVNSANTFTDINFNFAGANNFFGKVKQLQVFKTALTDSELATLTT